MSTWADWPRTCTAYVHAAGLSPSEHDTLEPLQAAADDADTPALFQAGIGIHRYIADRGLVDILHAIGAGTVRRIFPRLTTRTDRTGNSGTWSSTGRPQCLRPRVPVGGSNQLPCSPDRRPAPFRYEAWCRPATSGPGARNSVRSARSWQPDCRQSLSHPTLLRSISGVAVIADKPQPPLSLRGRPKEKRTTGSDSPLTFPHRRS